MQLPFGYTIKSTIHHGHGANVYRAERKSDGRPVILKMLGPRDVRPRDIERLRHELELGRELDAAAVVRPLALESYDGLPVLVLEDFGGGPLAELLGTALPIERFLELAIPIARAVSELHQLGVVHEDLKPCNIFVAPATGEVKLADLGIATRLPREQLAPRLGVIEGWLPYMAPERTGPMNRAIDARSDLYSLGVVLYEMATGRLPFPATDPVEWVHCHIAQAPEPAGEVVPALPAAVSAVVDRLLAKAPEARYQSAAGLVHDLEQARARLARGDLEPFPLGTHDFSDRFEIPPRLYGREREIATLISVIKASQTISSEIVLDKLLGTLLEVVVEQGAAQRGCLLLARHAEPDQLRVEAETTCDEAGRHTRVLHSAPLDATADVPLSVVDYARRTGQRVVVDAGAVHPFTSDPYLARARPRSLLCLPIVRQTAVAGVLVLQNDLVAGAFTPDRLAVLELLASQAAISLDNARFVEREHAARAAAERAELRSSFLSHASALLGAPLEDEPPAARIAELALRLPADWCEIDVLDDAGELRRMAARHTDPTLQPVLDELVRQGPPRRDLATAWLDQPPVREAHAPVLLDRPAIERAVDAEQLARLDQLGARSVLIVPLTARRRLLGRITLARGTPRPPFAPDERELARELGHRVAIAFDNAALYRGIQQAVRARDDFLSVASHELRTPMTSLKLSLDMLQLIGVDTKGDPRATRLLELVYRQRDRLDRLIGDLLDATRAEHGKLLLDVSELDLAALLRDVAARFELDLRQSGSTLTVAPSEPVVGRWDRSYLEQVVTNLISNANKFGQGKPIAVALATRGARAELTVSDQGIGIPPERARHVFERFERAVSARHYGGLGLGLYISRRIIEAHGGTIRFESKPGEGTRFFVELPLEGPS